MLTFIDSLHLRNLECENSYIDSTEKMNTADKHVLKTIGNSSKYLNGCWSCLAPFWRVCWTCGFLAPAHGSMATAWNPLW